MKTVYNIVPIKDQSAGVSELTNSSPQLQIKRRNKIFLKLWLKICRKLTPYLKIKIDHRLKITKLKGEKIMD